MCDACNLAFGAVKRRASQSQSQLKEVISARESRLRKTDSVANHKIEKTGNRVIKSKNMHVRHPSDFSD
ncbi:hypothetical protein CR513_40363, partial [Mucuna pruriens]